MIERPLKSLHVAQTFGLYDRYGGTSHVTPLIGELNRLGHETAVIASAYPPKSPADTFRLGSSNDKGSVTFLSTSLRYRTLTINPGARTVFEKRVPDFDVVHIHGLYDLLGPASAAVCRANGVPYVVETMGMFKPISGGTLRKRLFMQLFGRSMIRGAARFVATSSREARDLLDAGLPDKRIAIRHNGAIQITPVSRSNHDLREKHGIDPKAPIVLFLGRIAPIKNIELLLSAFDGVSSRDSVLLVAGPAETNNYLARLKAISGNLSVARRIKFIGPIFENEKISALSEADLLVLPSHNENFGTVALEAMAVGTPVVVTDTCGIAEHVRDQGGLVVGLAVEEVRSAINQLLSDTELKTKLGDQAQSIAAGLSWESAANLTVEMYREVLMEAAVVHTRT